MAAYKTGILKLKLEERSYWKMEKAWRPSPKHGSRKYKLAGVAVYKCEFMTYHLLCSTNTLLCLSTTIENCRL